MARELWHASLNHSSPRYAQWREILGSDDVPLLSPFPAKAMLGEEEATVFALDWQNLDEEQSERLLTFLAAKFNVKMEEIQHDFDRDGYMPIREADITISYDMRAFL